MIQGYKSMNLVVGWKIFGGACLPDDRYVRIKLFSRKASGIKSEKIEEHLGDLMNPNQMP
jgi:hypothetical protein